MSAPPRRRARAAPPPAGPRLRLVVDEVVARGLTRRDTDRVLAALPGEVAALVAERGAPTRRSVPALERRASGRRGRPDPAALARAIAASLWEDDR